jgi:hypothetical protein
MTTFMHRQKNGEKEAVVRLELENNEKDAWQLWKFSPV